MKKQTRLFALFLFIVSTSVNGLFYKLFVNNCEGESVSHLLTHLFLTLLVSIGFAFLLQKIGVAFNFPTDKVEKDK